MGTSREDWTTRMIDGHACEVYHHPRPDEHGYVVLYLHGLDPVRLRDRPLLMKPLDRHGFHIVCPSGGPSWWLDRICPDFDPRTTAQAHVMKTVVPFIQQVFGTEPPRIALFGTGMGGQGALRFAYQFPDLFPVVAAVAPAIDFQIRWTEGDEVLRQMYEDPEAARQDTAILHIHPLNWPRNQFFCGNPNDDRWFDGVDRLRMKLGSIGVPFECDLETTAGKDGVPYVDTMAERAVTFLFERLERERMRIV